MKDEEVYKHPSYGQIRFSRVQGRNRFYGSELTQDHYITMEISKSELHRSLSREWYFGSNKNILQLRMTSTQFAELITSLNTGGGVPCTLEYIMKEKIDPLPELENRKEFIHRKFEDAMKELADKMKKDSARVKELTAKKTLSKADQDELKWMVDKIHQEVTSNIPFYAKCFQETMDEIVVEAKSEVESAIQHKITTLGLSELHKQNKLLND